MVSDGVSEDVSITDFIPPFPAAVHDLKCGDCGEPMVCRANQKTGSPFYGCSTFPGCRGTLGALPDGRPIGVPGDKATRKARIEAHRYFDMIWRAEEGKEPRMTRNQAYAWMRRKMKLSESEAHFGKFSQSQCEECVRLIKLDFPGVRTMWDRLSETDDF